MSVLPHFVICLIYKQSFGSVSHTHTQTHNNVTGWWGLNESLDILEETETYQMSLMRCLIEEHLYYSLIGHGQKYLDSNVMEGKDR